MEDGVYTLDVIGRTGEGITLFADIGKLNLFKKSRFRRYPFARVLGVNIFGYSANIEGYIFGNKNVIEILLTHLKQSEKTSTVTFGRAS